MKKVMLYGIGNEKKFNHYTFEKTRKTHEILNKILSKVFKIRWPLIREDYDDDKDEPIITEVDISKNEDFHEILTESKNKDNRIDIFYGKKKMFITIHCPLKKRREFHDKIRKISEMPEPKRKIKAKVVKIKK